MNKRIVLIIDNDEYLLPVEQTKDLTSLLANISAWEPVDRKSYNERGEWKKKADHPHPSIQIEVVEEKNISDAPPSDVGA